MSAFGEKNQKAADEAAKTSSTEVAAATRKRITDPVKDAHES
jgi:hypothetical protein